MQEGKCYRWNAGAIYRTFPTWDANIKSERTEFLRTDLAFCFTLSDLVETVLGLNDLNAASRVKADAEERHNDIARVLVNMDDGADKDELRRELSELRTRLDGLAASHSLLE